MIYKQFKDKKLSWLGMGGMRLPVTEANGPIDEQKAMELIEHAYNSGINYYDTSYFYHGGNSESFLGKALSRFPRETWYLADKMPGNLMKYENGKLEVSGFGLPPMITDGPAEVFQYQLDKCGVEYFDFYLLHNLSEATYHIYANDELAFVEYLLEEKKAGRIKHLGFSAHGRVETIEKYLKYLESKGLLHAIEFVMIQLNYLDWTLQEAGKKHELLTKYGIPVFVMEPVRGGKLANLSEKAEAMMKAARPNDTQVSWAFRYLQSLENIPMILSGMSNMEQLKENLELFENVEAMTAEEKGILTKIVETVADLAPCTDCKYCVDYCPMGLNIPKLLSMYNEAGFEVSWTLKATLSSFEKDKLPSACISCGACNPLCPQSIDIPDALHKFSELLNN